MRKPPRGGGTLCWSTGDPHRTPPPRVPLTPVSPRLQAKVLGAFSPSWPHTWSTQKDSQAGGKGPGLEVTLGPGQALLLASCASLNFSVGLGFLPHSMLGWVEGALTSHLGLPLPSGLWSAFSQQMYTLTCN